MGNWGVSTIRCRIALLKSYSNTANLVGAASPPRLADINLGAESRRGRRSHETFQQSIAESISSPADSVDAADGVPPIPSRRYLWEGRRPRRPICFFQRNRTDRLRPETCATEVLLGASRRCHPRVGQPSWLSLGCLSSPWTSWKLVLPLTAAPPVAVSRCARACWLRQVELGDAHGSR